MPLEVFEKLYRGEGTVMLHKDTDGYQTTSFYWIIECLALSPAAKVNAPKQGLLVTVLYYEFLLAIGHPIR